MCGIAGVVDLNQSTPAEHLEEIVGTMAMSLAHRGPDDKGVWVDPKAGIALGHRRLSIIDLSPMGHQPMVSADGRYVATYNGEIYNFQALRDDLTRRGHRFRGSSDTEVLLEAVAEWGVGEAVQRLNGMFAIAVWDRGERVLTLLRDRLGEKPLYYGWLGRRFVFASEIKALRRHPDFSCKIDRAALALFLRYQYIPAPWSIYEGIQKLKAGHLLELQLGVETTPEQVPYWSAREVAERGVSNLLPADDVVDALDETLRKAVSLRMVADVPLGAFLSGGIDSSTVVALMQAQSTSPVRTFTIGFHESEYDEARHANAVAAHLGTEHTELYVTPADALAVIPRLPHVYDEPFADTSQVPTCLLAELTRRHVTVALSGDGGDELFIGYDRYTKARRLMRARRFLPRTVRARIAELASRRPPRGRAHAIATLLEFDAQRVYQTMVSHWERPLELVRDAHEPVTALSDPEQWGGLPGLNEELSYLDLVTYLPDDILAKVDRATMAVSLEARVPLLDPEVVELAWRIPPHSKLHRGHGKWPLRRVLYRYVPRKLVERPKMGFGVPIDHWLRGPLREWAESLLAESRLRREGFLEPEPIRQAWEEHVAGRANRHIPLWDVLMFQAWLDAQSTVPVT